MRVEPSPDRWPDPGRVGRFGKFALWMPLYPRADWPERLVEVLENWLIFRPQPACLRWSNQQHFFLPGIPSRKELLDLALANHRAGYPSSPRFPPGPPALIIALAGAFTWEPGDGSIQVRPGYHGKSFAIIKFRSDVRPAGMPKAACCRQAAT